MAASVPFWAAYLLWLENVKSCTNVEVRSTAPVFFETETSKLLLCLVQGIFGSLP